jgi:hypothetical protein
VAHRHAGALALARSAPLVALIKDLRPDLPRWIGTLIGAIGLGIATRR